jgi:saccharopine dehydrogenase (NADP+, L-glutamate forming)
MNTAKHILLLGAGKSATVLIDYLKEEISQRQWQLVVADHDLELTSAKVGTHPHARSVKLDILNIPERRALIDAADVVISMMPPALHLMVAKDCLELGKHLLTASYIEEELKTLEAAIRKKGLLFLCEMGLDPGIDHMSAMQLIHQVHSAGGILHSFKSHCGGLVAPESDNNPWHYKISWNPRNVVLSGKAGAVWREKGITLDRSYKDMFAECPEVSIEELGKLAYYPNRDSLGYIHTYQLEEISTFVRTTLRYPDFCKGWNLVVQLQLTDETIPYNTDGISMREFLQRHLQQHRLNFSIEGLSDPALQEQFRFLGLDSHEPLNRGICTAADVMQYLLEQKLALHPRDKDMIVMLHEIDYELKDRMHSMKSSLVVKGENSLHTAMAKTVGLPLGIATVLLLDGKIKETGLHIPISPAVYEPVLAALAKQGIRFHT